MSWTVIGNNDLCEIVTFNVLLVSVPMGIYELTSTDMNSYNFTGLPDDTLFNITIIGSSMLFNTDPVSTSIRTIVYKSMYTCAYTITCLYVLDYIVYAYVHSVWLLTYICRCIYVRTYIAT